MTVHPSSPADSAIVAVRSDRPPADTDEIAALAQAAGYHVVGALTQVRREDPGTHLGAGKVAELTDRATAQAVDAVVLDARLTPGQHRNLTDRLPDAIQVLDRLHLVLEIFAAQAPTKRARLQVERVQLERDLARFEADADEGWFNRRAEKGSPRYDLQDRIARIERELAEAPDPTDALRRRRRERGFDLVTIAGYTNAGKSTLLHRLADDLDPDAAAPAHPDEDAVAAIEDRLFKTLETTTRRATLRGRPVLVTDTVGYVAELSHDLVAAFSATLSEAAAADAVVLLADATDGPDAVRDKLAVSYDVLDEQGVDRADVVLALNKADAIDEAALHARRAVAREFAADPIAISALDATNVAGLVDAIVERIPTDRRQLSLAHGDEAMRLVSAAYDRLVVHDVDYRAETVHLDVEGRPTAIDRLFETG